MLDILVLLIMAVAAIRSARVLRRHRELFVAFGVATTVVPLVWLFPLSPLALFGALLIGMHPLIACAIAVALLVPGVLAVRKAAAAFERCGTDRAQPVLDALSVAFISGAGGIAYAVVALAVRQLMQVMAPVG